ncbi:hypothetical protein AB1K84_05855 [Mesobacillus foraminis]|jgi:hypothetical protein|uniref:Uncharacterized protein n=1 Tax=Mesobacillus foraminis TaxID=279826 RepID=A0A4R2BLT3_9BACI|nr:hypothetical protein [Mesobacillus foraminis]MBT2755278.1 hypothetical protein [Mesobacillus foraminis]TCN27199.1 hypothetical protein EV146_102145 [Mesobacillus foraminis]
MAMDLTLQQLVENLPKSLLNASDRDLEGFQKIIEETVKLREGHRNLQRMVKNFSTSTIQRS